MGGESKEINAKRLNDEIHKRGLDNNVIYLGRKYGEDKNKEYEKSDVFVFPTKNETFGLVLLEAMQQSIPIIASEEGGIPDIIKDGYNGLIVNKDNSRELATAIKTMLDNPEFAHNLGKNGREHFLKFYTLGKWEECLNSVFQSVMGGVNTAPI